MKTEEQSNSGARISPWRDALLTALGVAGVLTLTVYTVSLAAQRRFEDQARGELTSVALSAAMLVDANAHAAISEYDAHDDETMSILVAPLRALGRVHPAVEHLYTLVPDGDSFRVVLDTKGQTRSSPHVIPNEAREALSQNRVSVSSVYHASDRRLVSAYAPLVSASGEIRGIVGVDAPASILHDVGGEKDRVRLYGTIFTLVCTLGAALVVYLMRAAVRDAIDQHDSRLAMLEAKALDVAHAQERAGSVLATMSHELRTPLTAILGFTELLLDPSEDVGVLRSHAQTIRRNSQHLLGVLNDVLDISKIDAGMMRIECGPCDPVRVARDVVDLLGPRAAEKDLKLELTNSGQIPERLDVDAFRVRQILLNLVNNAVKFTEGGQVKVCVSYALAERRLEYAVSDSGVGIDPADLDAIFAPFHQGTNDSVHHHSGTGLGLAISKRLAVRMGGDLTVVSRVGGGSTFTLQIPAEVSTPREETQDVVTDRQLDTWIPRPSWHVLVVEDTLEHQKLFFAFLRRAGHAVDVCDNGDRGLRRIRESEYLREPYTVVLIDVYLRGESGLALSRSMREHGYRGPILAVTADSTTEMREQCLAAGCDDVYAKPIERASLLAALTRLVRAGASAGAA